MVIEGLKGMLHRYCWVSDELAAMLLLAAQTPARKHLKDF